MHPDGSYGMSAETGRRTGDGRAGLGSRAGKLAAAEEVRFELTGPLRAHRFSRPTHSATLPLLRDVEKCSFSSLSSTSAGRRSGYHTLLLTLFTSGTLL